jgi:hypothetical protein
VHRPVAADGVVAVRVAARRGSHGAVALHLSRDPAGGKVIITRSLSVYVRYM